jgi:antitoxin MazE
MDPLDRPPHRGILKVYSRATEVHMVTKVQKWGNSLGVRLPKKLAEDLSIDSGTEVDIKVVRGRLVLMPILAKRLDLDDLLAKVRPSNIHGEADFGPARGREAW